MPFGWFQKKPAGSADLLDASHATDTDRAMMSRALDLARHAASAGEVPVGAIVYRTDTDELIAQGANTREHDKDPAGHAELIAMRQAAESLGDWRLSGCTLVVTLEPCVMCAGLIVNARVGRLVYGASDPKAGAVESLYRVCQDARLNHRITPIAGVMADESSHMLKEFFRARRKSSQV
ncbi:MAG: tRNA adenosine(34) deaminase TadA [Planctomycetota bacterium]|jgi:tRNA(adenine34) deaminase